MSIAEELTPVPVAQVEHSARPWGWLVLVASAIGIVSGSITIMDKIALLKRLDDAIPLGRMCEPEEIARVAAFLASDDASFITGQNIAVNGGMAFI